MAFQWVYIANLTGPPGDAAAMGRFDGIDTRLGVLEVGTPLATGANLNTLLTPGVYRAETFTIARSIVGIPTGTLESFVVDVRRLSATSNVYIQTLTEWTANGPLVSTRLSNQGTYAAWSDGPPMVRTALASGASLNTLMTPGIYRAETYLIARSIIGIPAGTVETFTVEVRKLSPSVFLQTLTEWSANGPIVSRRLSLGGTYAAWTDSPAWDHGVLASGASLDALTTPGIYRAETYLIARSIIGIPPGTLETFTVEVRKLSGASNAILQTLTEWSATGPIISRRLSNQGTFAAWLKEDEAARTRVTVPGDSLVEGTDVSGAWPAGAPWPAQLATRLPGVTVTNMGRGGDTTDDVLIRMGALPLRFTVTGGSIPASGAVGVTTGQVISTRDNRTYNGSIAGVAGVLSTGVGRAWTFTRTTSGTAVAVSGSVQFVPTGVAFDRDTLIFWAGRNDVDFGTPGQEQTIADHVVANYQLFMEWAKPRVKHVVLVGVTTNTTEHSGGAKYEIIKDINNRLRSLYPGKFADAQNYLVNRALTDMGLTPTTADTAAKAAGEIPPQLYAAGDTTHFSQPTAAALAQYFFAPYLLGKGWV